MPVTRMQAAGRRSIVLSARAALALLLLLAFLHGALYALFLPPWGLIDEAQHLHYIQYIAEQQALPVAGELYLSDEIVDSLFATRRWQTFHWAPPAAHDPQLMGLEGHSYEAYQPPLFYLLMTPLYWAFPQDMLVKVYGLRLMVVLLSLIPVWAIYRTARLLLPQFPRFSQLPFWAGLLLVAIPERAIATSRINNDVLLEVLAAIFVMLLTHAAVAGLTSRRAFLLGLLLGLAVWVKIPAGLLGIPLLLLLWLHRHERGWMSKAGWILVAAAPLGGALALRNLWLYGDLTGFSAFDQLHRLAPVDPSLGGFVRVLISLPNHLWLVWWKGSEVGGNGLLTAFYLLMALVVAGAWGTLLLHFRRTPHDARRAVALLYALTVLIYAFAVVGSYYEGMVPVIQGRFLLPALLPFVLLLVWGLWLTGRGEAILLGVVVLLWGMGLFSLFGNLVPYFYYWSDVVQGTMPAASSTLWQEVLWTYQRALLDKPSFLAPLLLLLPLCYVAALIFTFIVTLRAMTPLRHQQAGEDHLLVHP
ncbi:MAG: glycosyltransferase family 39 protein [Caldilineaceae bacterium]|nr:glycosyltransferase family 39 protein [Caldilineaceae bacterium]